MCGIAGLLKFQGKNTGKGIVEKMVEIQRHRGPDDCGFYFDDNMALGHARLSIIDLSQNAHQPMPNEDKSKWIIHNGEVYNYAELREELIKLGHTFRSKSDTEAILHAFEEWGESALNRFNGMWAFAIWDANRRELFVARDRFGIKPFYYYRGKNIFLFSSEIKALLIHEAVEKRPNEQAIYDYLISGYGYMDISDYTFFKDIYQLKSAHYMRINTRKKETVYKKYWDLDIPAENSRKSEKEYVEGFSELFRDAVRLRLRSDVKVGIALSGGLDSSAIACMSNRLHRGERLSSFSSCFAEKDADERGFINEVVDANNLEANLVFTDPKDLESALDEIIWHQEEPYSTLSIFPQWYVMRLAREKGVKVLLTGEAGDETLAGYHKYYFYLFADLFKNLKLKSAFKEIMLYRQIKGEEAPVSKEVLKILLSDILPGFLKNTADCFIKNTPPYLNKDFVNMYKKRVYTEKKFTSILNNDLYNAFKISPLPSLLHIDDRSSMAHSVESRCPFLDYRLVEYAFSVPAEYKIRDGKTKFILREAMRDSLPESVTERRDKMGFPAPLKSWLKGPLQKTALDIFNSREFINRPYFNHKEVTREFKLLFEENRPNELTVWSWLNLELWFRKYIDKI